MRPGPLGSSSTSIVPFGGVSSRAERVRRVQEASDRFRTGFEARHGRHAGFEARWADPTIDDAQAAAIQIQPRGAFLAQLIAQEQLGAGLTLDDVAGPLLAYRRAALDLVEIRTGATVDSAA